MTVVIASGNSLILSGGVVEAAVGITNYAGTLAGFGTVIGETVFTGTGTLTPGFGNTVGTIVASNDLTLASGTTTTIKLNESQAGSNDEVIVVGNLTEAGTLVITNVGSALTGGEVFQVFSGGGVYGSFAATNLPSLSSGLGWDTSQLGSAGIISVPIYLSVSTLTNQSFNVGNDVTISAMVLGEPTPTLQWQYNGTSLSDGPTGDGSVIVGSLTSALTISNAQAGEVGEYCLIASNTQATQTNCMYLSQIGGPQPPSISGPANQSVAVGGTAVFSAIVTGVPAPTVQWQQNGTNIGGATSTTLSVTNVQLSMNGYVYSIIASNSSGEATNSATLTIITPIPTPALPVIPTNTFFITNYGAYGDGSSNNASAIQSAIKAAAASGGGTVIVASVGVLTNYLSGPIYLTNNVSLMVSNGTMLQALPYSSWPSKYTAFITATNVHDVAIDGFGTIDGQGSNWWAAGGTRPPLVQMAFTTRILIQNVTAQNPPFYHFRLIGGNTNLTVQNITINTPTNSPNTDGVDVSVVNALIQNCWIKDGDDDVCIKNDTGLPSANIVVSNCTFYGGHGISVGSNIAGGLNTFIVNNCSWNATIYGIRCKSDNSAFKSGGSGAGGLVQNLGYYNLTMNDVDYPIVIYSYYNEVGTPDEIDPATAAGEDVGSTNNCVIYRNITISNVTATVGQGKNTSVMIWGRLEEPVSNLVIDAFNLSPSNRTFTVFNAKAVQILDSNLGTPIGTNALTLFNAQVTITNSVPSTNLVTVCGGVAPGTNNIIGLVNGVATIGNTNVLGPDQVLTVGSGTLTVSNAVNLGGSTLNFSLGTNAAKIAATGNLTLGGTLNVADGGGFNTGTYTLFTYGGALTYSGLSIGTTPNANFGYAISTSTSGRVSLIVSNIVRAPVANFSASPLSGAVPLSVSFTDIPSNSPTAWYWTFGDGGTSVSENPGHTYTTPGTYTVTLIASDSAGSSTDTCVNCITVLQTPPVAGFLANPTSGAAPLSVSFTDIPSNSPTAWYWTFGDGGTSTTESPMYTYLNPGSYTPTLIASNAGGASSPVGQMIGVYDSFAWWQLRYFGSTNNSANTAPGADYTGTGMSNSNKFLAGFNPTNPSAYLHIISIVNQVVAGSMNVVVTYLGANGDNTYTPGIAARTNVLDFTTGGAGGGYTSGGWQDTGQTNILSGGNGSGTITSMTDSAIPSGTTNRFYRVRVLTP
jgi:PKD repeat protein/polygalacturonase